VAYDDLVNWAPWRFAREKGLYRMEGKEYVSKMADVAVFK